jgi:hypothetical protein
VFDPGRFYACVGFVDAGFDLWGRLGGEDGWRGIYGVDWDCVSLRHSLSPS